MGNCKALENEIGETKNKLEEDLKELVKKQKERTSKLNEAGLNKSQFEASRDESKNKLLKYQEEKKARDAARKKKEEDEAKKKKKEDEEEKKLGAAEKAEKKVAKEEKD